LAKSEPRNLRRWTTTSGRLFTCGRPGRGTYGTNAVEIGEDTIDRWVTGLPEGDPLHIVSLLGRKQGGMSEFSYYRSGLSRRVGSSRHSRSGSQIAMARASLFTSSRPKT
jgi:hypothetical protein